MPIYEFACPRCRIIFSFLSKRIQSERKPKCPKCGSARMHKEVSRFAHLKGVEQPKTGLSGEEGMDPEGGGPTPDFDDPRVQRVMSEMERDMEHLDENNPKHMAHMMRKMKDLLPPGSAPKEIEMAIKRLEAGEDPEKIEEDMGDVLGDFMGGPGGGGAGGAGGGYSRDEGLYDY